MTEPLLAVDDLVAQYTVARGIVGTLRRRPRRSVRAVDGVSLELRPGELLAIVGESGCGKTSTARALVSLVESSRGTIRFDGADITHPTAGQLRGLRRDIQIVYQDPYESLDPWFRVRQTLEEPLIAHGIGTPAERRERIAGALERAGLVPPERYLERFPHELSGGQRQRVALAAALVLEPKLLIADEPVSMLDISVRAGILEVLERLRRSGLAILMITHDLSTAAHYADRIAVMYLGRVVEEGPAWEVVQHPRHPYTQALISVVPKPDPRDRTTPQILSGETPNATEVPPGCRFHPRCPARYERCGKDDPDELFEAGERGHRAACWLVPDGR
jgi:oligopeptide/dipeptide ABC transporter ATP-binding protein